MDILVLGCSGVFLRRVLPALNKCSNIEMIHVASKNKSFSDIDLNSSAKIGLWFDDYVTAINSSPAELVYISLPNSLHFKWTKRALNAGLHVVVEKPATMELSDARYLVDLSVKKGLCLAEATVWQYHPNVKRTKELISRSSDQLINVNATFTVPHFDANNFRNFSKFGGGAFNDMSAYAASIARVLFDENPSGVSGKILAFDKSGEIDTKFEVRIKVGEYKVVKGLFGFGLGYKNKLVISGNDFEYDLSRVFSPPSDIGINLKTIISKSSTDKLSQGDSYTNFFESVLDTLYAPEKTKWSDIMLQDALVTNQIKESFKASKEI